MENVNRYCVVCKEPSTFTTDVEELLKDKWQPLGGVSLSTYKESIPNRIPKDGEVKLTIRGKLANLP